MDEEETIRNALMKHKPADVWLYMSDEKEPTRKIAVPAKKHRWEAAAQVIVKLQWDRLELRDRSGNILGVVSAAADEPEPELAAAPPGPAPNDERLLRLMLQAQESALKNRSQETQQALNASVGIVEKMAVLVGQLVELTQVQIDATRVAVQRAQARPAAPAVAAQSDIDQLKEALELAKIVFPALTSGDAAANGAKKPAADVAKEGD